MPKAVTRQIPAEAAEELAFEGTGEVSEDGDWKVVADEEGDSSRWMRHHTLVLEYIPDGTLWGVDYSRGLTENQDHDFPWRPDYGSRPETVEAYQLWPHTVTTVDYKAHPPKTLDVKVVEA